MTSLPLWRVTSVALLVSAVLAPLVGDLGSFRYPHLALSIVLAVRVLRGQRVEARRHDFALVAIASLAWCLSIVTTRHLGFTINGVDFSIFDWQVASTARGHFGYSPIYDVNHFGTHSTFLLLALVPLHALAPSPFWLLVLGAVAVWAGIFPLRRLARSVLGDRLTPDLELLVLLAWLDNGWLGRLLNAGFRIESLTPLMLLWFLVGWCERRPVITVAACVAGLWVKEDVALMLPAFVVPLAVRERDRRWLAAAITLLCLGWLGLYVGAIQPALAGTRPTYLSFWQDFGDSAGSIVLGILTHPLTFAKLMVTSGWWMLALPTLGLPFTSMRALAGMAPTLVMLGASSNPSMHDYMTYYPVALVPFLVLGLLDTSARAGWWFRLSVIAIGAFPLFWYGYARGVRPNLELERDVKAAVTSAGEHRLVVETILFPHVGYGKNLVPFLDEAALVGSPGDVYLLAPALDSWPFEYDAPRAFAERLEACGTAEKHASGLVAIRLERFCDARSLQK